MEYHQITLSEYMEMKESIRRELQNQAESFIRTGYQLRKIEDTEAYRQDGYSSVYEMAEKEFNLSKTTVSRLKAINKEFSVDGYSLQIDPRYKGIGKTILADMLALPGPDRDLITPETPREEVRELARFNRDDHGEDRTPLYDAFSMFLEKTPDAAMRVERCIKAGNADATHLSEAVAPSGSKMFRAGTKFIAFTKVDIKVKTFGTDKQEIISWEEFAKAAAAWIAERENDGARAEDDTDRGTIGADERRDQQDGGDSRRDSSGSDSGSGEKDPGIYRDVAAAERGSEEPDTVPENRESSDDAVHDENAGSEHGDQEEDSGAEVRQGEAGGNEANYDDQNAESEAEEPEAAAGAMNPPIVGKEAVAPAQQRQKNSGKIVDETGKPAPEQIPEDQKEDIRERRSEAIRSGRQLSSYLYQHKWRDALIELVDMQKMLQWLMENDKEG